ncbi:MAG: right-handed parallel beta-helix repeat-containing protein, partial [Acidobacteriota bacterium]
PGPRRRRGDAESRAGILRRVLTATAALASTAALFVLASPLAAAVHTVDVTTDSVDAVPGDGDCADALGECSLRAAVMESNAAPGADEIVLGEALYELTIPECGEGTAVAYDDACGDLDVTGVLTVRGVGAYRTMVTADGLAFTGNGGHFDLSSSGDLTLRDLMLRDGEILGSGGAIRNQGGLLEVRDCVLYGNTASFAGGAIEARDGVTSISGTLILGNQARTATIGGGGIYHSNDSAPAGTTLSITNSTLAFNTVLGGAPGQPTNDGKGGGLSLFDNASVQLTQVTIHGNRATGDGGGIFIDSLSGPVILEGCTVTGNRADSDGDTGKAPNGNGGGLSNEGAPGVEVYNTLIAGNLDPAPVPALQRPDCRGTLSVLSHSLVERQQCGVTTITNLLTGDPGLLPYGDRGGSIPTVGFGITSAARDAADGSRCPLLDARGELRFQNGACDIGAWESGYDPRFLVKTSLDASDLVAGDTFCAADFLPALTVCTLRA